MSQEVTSFKAAPLQHVILPYLPEDWASEHPPGDDAFFQTSKLKDASNTTVLGDTVYVRTKFNFHDVTIVERASGKEEIISPDPHVGEAWVLDGADHLKPDCSIITQTVLNRESHLGAYSFYPRTKREKNIIPDMQKDDARNHLGSDLGRLPDRVLADIVEIVCAESDTPYAFRCTRKEKEIFKDTSRHMACNLSRTCRLLNAEVRRHWFMRSCFVFYDPDQLTRFLACIKRQTFLLACWPCIFQAVVLETRIYERGAMHLRTALRNTAAIPLAQCPADTEKSKNGEGGERKGAKISKLEQPPVGGDGGDHYELILWLRKMHNRFEVLFVGRTDDWASEEAREEARKRQELWITGVKDLVSTYRVRQLIIRYEDEQNPSKLRIFENARVEETDCFLESIVQQY